VTDAGLSHLMNMKKLNHLTITGTFTEGGLKQLAHLPALGYLNFNTKSQASSAVEKYLKANLTHLYTFRINGVDSSGKNNLRAAGVSK